MLVKKTFYLVKLHKLQIPIHSKGMNLITHSLHISYPNPFSIMLKLPISYPIHKKKKKIKEEAKILVKVYNILFNYIPILYPIQKKSFHYTFKGHELHIHFITIHSKGVSHSFHYIPISYPFITIRSLPISYPKQ